MALYVGAASTVFAVSAASGAASIPAGVPGDVLVGLDWANNATSTYSAAGWLFGTAANGIQFMWRWADGTEGATITVNRLTNTAGIFGVVIERYRDLGEVSVNAVTSQTSTTATNIVLTGVTTPEPNCDVISIAVKLNASTNGWTSPPAQQTERFDIASSGAQASRAAGGDELVAAAGATGTRTWARDVTDTGQARGGVIAFCPRRRVDHIRSVNPALARASSW